MESTRNRSFKERIESLILSKILNSELMKNHLLVFDIESNDKRQVFFDAIAKTNWRRYDPEIHDYNDDFDYIYLNDSILNPKALFDLFKNLNGKTIIFDNESLLKKQTLINVLEGAICSSPDSCAKWSVNLEGHKKFTFKGSVIILTCQQADKFMKTKKYEYLTRDMLKA
jgi:hypothetical protein